MTTEAERLAQELDDHASQDWSDVSALLRQQAAEADKANALLRQAFGAMQFILSASDPMTSQQRQCWPSLQESCAAIKQHLGEV